MGSDKGIRFAKIISTKRILPGLAAADKEEAIRELVGVLVKGGAVEESRLDEITEAVLEREKLGSTGIGNGVAVPHAKLSGIEEPVGALGRLKEGIDFSSLDGAITHSVFLFLSPADDPPKHTALMSRFVTVLRNPDFVRFLRQTDGKKALHDFLGEVDGW